MSITTIQPTPKPLLLPSAEYHLLEKNPTSHAHSQCGSQCKHYDNTNEHRQCHTTRRNRLLMKVLAGFIALLSVLAITCLVHASTSIDWSAVFSWEGVGLTETLARRAVGDGTGSGTGNSFVNRKLYLIVVFVGLFVVVILGIMLSAWCCRGAFENPLCCPCYLCACCGGLACLECIGCGLCAEGMDQM